MHTGVLWVGYCTTDTVTALYLLLSLPPSMPLYWDNNSDIFHLITSQVMHKNEKQDEIKLAFHVKLVL